VAVAFNSSNQRSAARELPIEASSQGQADDPRANSHLGASNKWPDEDNRESMRLGTTARLENRAPGVERFVMRLQRHWSKLPRTAF
jgi:hypothetical protein